MEDISPCSCERQHQSIYPLGMRGTLEFQKLNCILTDEQAVPQEGADSKQTLGRELCGSASVLTDRQIKSHKLHVMLFQLLPRIKLFQKRTGLEQSFVYLFWIFMYLRSGLWADSASVACGWGQVDGWSGRS